MKLFGDNLLSFLDIWTTKAVDDTVTPNVDNTITIANARGAAIIWFVIGLMFGPAFYRKTGWQPLF